MMRKALAASLVGLSIGATWTPVNHTFVSWPANAEANVVGTHAQFGGAEVEFWLGDESITNGTGSCEVGFGNLEVAFVHFYYNEVQTFEGGNAWTVFNLGERDQSGDNKVSFVVLATEEPAFDNLTITCQTELGVDTGTVLFSSFPATPDADSASGFLTAKDGVWPDALTVTFDIADNPRNFTVDDGRLTVDEQGTGTYLIQGFNHVNFDHLGVKVVYEEGVVTPAWAISTGN